ncbi:MAG TPA: ankyrin repeat domain-containing protein [Herpetosiphonaceae bacterium]
MSDEIAREPVWCLVANVSDRYYFGEQHEPRAGTRHFSTNTKVYCLHQRWGDGYEQIRVVGRHRKQRKLSMMVLHWTRLTNWRVKAVYHPHVVNLLDGGWLKHYAEAMARSLDFRERAHKAKIEGFALVGDPDEALLYASFFGLVEPMREALERGASVESRTRTGTTPLLLAIYAGSVDAVRLLLEHGADPAAADSWGQDAWACAAEYWWETRRAQLLDALGVKPWAVPIGLGAREDGP